MRTLEAYEVMGECADCGDTRVLYKDTKRCDNCDSRYTHCSICDEEQHDEDHCRHIFENEYGQWMGSGAYMDEDAFEHIQRTLYLLLDEMPAGFAQALRAAISTGKFHTWACLPLIGGGGTLELHGMPRHEGHWANTWWGDFLMEIGQGDLSEQTADAYHWLASLYDHKTPKANATTIGWLDSYIALERAARLYGKPA